MDEWDKTLANSALLIWDIQYGIASKAFNLNDILGKIKSLREVAHSLGKPVIYTQTTGLPYEYQSKFSKYRLRRRGVDPRTANFMLEGSHDWQILDEIIPDTNDIVIKKYTPSLFVGTNAEQLLINSGVDSLIITGVSTENGVETTARHASCLGFIPVVAEDAVGSGDKLAHESSLIAMRRMFELRRTDEILQTFKNPLR